MKSFFALVTIVILGALQYSASAQESTSSSVVVRSIKGVTYSIEKSNPANLLVTATATLRSGGYSNFVLSRAEYKKPPKDGIQDYYFQATPPSGPATQGLVDEKASNKWKAYPPWVTGVRIHGSGPGVRTMMLGNEAPKPVQVVGRSSKGDLSHALADALSQVDKLIASSGVSDQQASWKIVEIGGNRGGIAGLKELAITLDVEMIQPVDP